MKTRFGGWVAVALVALLGGGSVWAEPIRVALTFDDGNKDHLLIVAPMLEERGWRGTFNIVTDWIGTDENSLSWADVRDLVRRGHEIATHTKSHPNLVALLAAGKEEAVRRELAESRDLIAAETGFTPRFMCSPGVRQNDETARICREEGLRQMIADRIIFGDSRRTTFVTWWRRFINWISFGFYNCDQVRACVDRLAAKGVKRIDFLHHGIAANEHGGWCAFKDRESFRRHLDALAQLEKEGRIIVTDYDGMVSDCALKAKAWPRHGVVALSFDDHNCEMWEKAFPLFAKYDARATFFLCGAVGTNEVVFMRKALSAGLEPGLHGLRHQNADVVVAARGADAYWQDEMEPQVAACRAAGIPIHSFAYPNCRRNADTDAAFFKRGFTRLRGSDKGVKTPNPHDPQGVKLAEWTPVATCDPMFYPAEEFFRRRNIRNVIMGENYHTDIEDILAAMRRAGERAEVLSIVSHGIAPDAKGISMKTEWLERMLSSARAAGVLVRGVR